MSEHNEKIENSSGASCENDQIDYVINIEKDEDEYFASYEDIEVHKLMIEDEVRTNAYMNAISNAAVHFSGKTVMDVGAGTGILSLFCAKAGAKKVYAVEASKMALIIPKIAEQNGLSSIIDVKHSRIEDLKLDEKVDIIVSEWMGFYLLHESMLDTVLFARDNFLNPNGLIFPNAAKIYAAPCTLPEMWNKEEEFWKEKKYGFDLSPLAQMSKLRLKPEIMTVKPESILSEPQELFSLNLNEITLSELELLKDTRFFSVEEDGDVHGVCIWFSCSFPFDEHDELNLSTSPWGENTHWKQTIVLLPEPNNVEAGDILGWEFFMVKAKDHATQRTYDLKINFLDPETEEHPVPCNCGHVKCEIIKYYLNNQKEIVSSNEDAKE